MAKIISVSLNEELLADIDSASESIGFSGRSEAIRAAMKALLDELKEKEQLKGHAECILIFVHGKKFEDAFTKAKHRYEDIINTQVHTNFCNDKCLQVCILHGSAEKIKSLFADVKRNKHVDYVKLVVP